MRGWLILVLLLVPSVAAQEDPLSPEQRAWLEENGPIQIATPGSTPPMGFVEDGRVKGMFHDLVELAALKTGTSVEFVPVISLNDLAPMLATGEVDLVGPLAARPDLADRASSDPVATVPVVFVTNSEHPEFVDVADITGRTSTLPGFPMEAQLRSEFSHLEYVETPNATVGIRMLASGELDSYYGPLVFLGYAAQEQGFDDFRPVGDPQDLVRLRLWGADAASVPLSILQEGIEQMTDNEMRVLHAKWTGFDLTEPSEASPALPGWVPVLFWTAIALFVLTALANLFLRRQVRVATRDLQQLNDELEERITERTQELESQSQDLEDSNERLERFAYMASHDLQAPLRHISSFAEFLAEDLEGQLGDEDEEHLKGIQEGVERMRERIQALLTFSRVQRIDLTFEPVPMADVVARAAADVGAELEECGGELEVGPLPTVTGDRSLLTQVLQNLLQNAIRYRGEQPLKIQVLGETTSAGHEIHIVDNGRGFAPEHAERIFGMFKRLQNDQGGSGIGLAVCRVIIERHGGTIEAGAHPDEGSTFTIKLPRSPT